MTKDTVYDGYMYNTTDLSIIRCFSKGHAMGLAEINDLGQVRILGEK